MVLRAATAVPLVPQRVGVAAAAALSLLLARSQPAPAQLGPDDGLVCRLEAAAELTRGEGVLGLAFAPDGQLLATRSADHRLRIWSLPEGGLLHEWDGYERGPVADLAFSHDGKRLLSLSPRPGEGLVIWNVADGRLLERIDQPGRLLHRSAQPGAFALVTPTYVMQFSLDNPQHLVPRYLVHNRPEVEPAAICPDEQHVLLYVTRAQVELSGHLLLVHQVGTASESLLYPFERPVSKGTFAPRGDRIAIVCRGDSRLHFRDRTRPHFQLVMEGTAGSLTDVKYSPDGRLLVTVADDGRVRLLETLTMRPILELENPSTRWSSSAFSDDGRRLAAGGAAGARQVAFVWDLPQWMVRLAGDAPATAPLPSEVWEQLGDLDPRVGYIAVGRLLRDADQGLAVLRERLQQQNNLTELQDLPRLISELDHASFAVRQAAFQRLLPLRQRAHAQLEAAWRQAPTVERRIQLQRLLDESVAAALGDEEERRRLHRAVGALELLGGPQAVSLVREIATGWPDTRIAEQAQDALLRMDSAGRL